MTEHRDKWKKYVHGRDVESSFFVGLDSGFLKIRTLDSDSGTQLESRLRGL